MKQIRQLSKKGVLPMLAIAILYPLIMGAFHQSYLILLGSYAMLYIIVVSGIDVLFGYSGQITIGHAGFYAIGRLTVFNDSFFYAIGAHGTAIIHNYLNLPPMLSILSHLVGYVSPDTFVRKQSVMFVTMLLFGGSALRRSPSARSSSRSSASTPRARRSSSSSRTPGSRWKLRSAATSCRPVRSS